MLSFFVTGKVFFVLLFRGVSVQNVYSFIGGLVSKRHYCNVMQLHPDSDPSNPALHSQFVELNEAYRVLSKDLSRKDYDIKIRPPYSGSQAFRSTSRTSYGDR